MTDSSIRVSFPLRALTISGCLALLASCASPGDDQGAPAATEGEAPGYEYESSDVETSPLLYDRAPAEPSAEGEDEPDEAYRQAARQCDSYARAVLEQDRRITHDRDSARGGQTGSSRTMALTRSMQNFSEQGSYERHFSSCMANRGFRPRS